MSKLIVQQLCEEIDALKKQLHRLEGTPTTSAIPSNVKAREDRLPHRDICIRFSNRGIDYKAVGYLKEKEERRVNLRDALCRAGHSGEVVWRQSDTIGIRDDQSQLPKELLKFGWLFTAQLFTPTWNFNAAGLYNYDGRWIWHGHAFHHSVDSYFHGLVLCRE